MFFNFTFRHFIAKPERLAEQLQNSTMRGFKKRILFVYLAGVILFAMRSWWGFNTESLTPLLTTLTTTDYTLARYASLAGSVIWSLIYVSFYIFGFSYILSALTYTPYKQILPLQVLMTSIMLIAKGLIFLVFAIKGSAVSVSFLSLGPIAATYVDIPFVVYFLNQISLVMVIIIALQYRFIRLYMEPRNDKRVLALLIGIHIFIALMIAAVGYIPADLIVDKLIGGGVGYE